MLIYLKFKCLSLFLCLILIDLLQSPTTGLWKILQTVPPFNGSYLFTVAFINGTWQTIWNSNIKTDRNFHESLKNSIFLTILYTILESQHHLIRTSPKLKSMKLNILKNFSESTNQNTREDCNHELNVSWLDVTLFQILYEAFYFLSLLNWHFFFFYQNPPVSGSYLILKE